MGAEAQNVLGRVGQVVGALESLRTPGGLQNFLVNRATALGDPRIRSVLEGSPGLAGFFGVGGSRPELAGPLQPGEERQRGPFQANLPPLDPATQLATDTARQGVDFQRNNPVLARVLQGLGTPEETGQIFKDVSGAVGEQAGNVVLRPGSRAPVTIAQLPPTGFLDFSSGIPLSVNPRTGQVSAVPARPAEREAAELSSGLEALRMLGLDPSRLGGGTGGTRRNAMPNLTGETTPLTGGRTDTRPFSGTGIMNGDAPPTPGATPPAPTTPPTIPPLAADDPGIESFDTTIDLPDTGFPPGISTPGRAPITPTPSVVTEAAQRLQQPSPPSRLPAVSGTPAPTGLEGLIARGPQRLSTQLGGQRIDFTKAVAEPERRARTMELFGTPDFESLGPDDQRTLRQAIERDNQVREANKKLLAGLSGEQQQRFGSYLAVGTALDDFLFAAERAPEAIQGLVGLGGLRTALTRRRAQFGTLSDQERFALTSLQRGKIGGFALGGQAFTGTEERIIFENLIPTGDERNLQELRAKIIGYSSQLADIGRAFLGSGAQFRLAPELQDAMRARITFYDQLGSAERERLFPSGP